MGLQALHLILVQAAQNEGPLENRDPKPQVSAVFPSVSIEICVEGINPQITVTLLSCHNDCVLKVRGKSWNVMPYFHSFRFVVVVVYRFWLALPVL